MTNTEKKMQNTKTKCKKVNKRQKIYKIQKIQNTKKYKRQKNIQKYIHIKIVQKIGCGGGTNMLSMRAGGVVVGQIPRSRRRALGQNDHLGGAGEKNQIFFPTAIPAHLDPLSSNRRFSGTTDPAPPPGVEIENNNV